MRRTRIRLALATAAASTLLTRCTHAADFTFGNAVFDDQQNVAGAGNLFKGTDQIVTGTGGAVATISEFANGPAITYTAPGGATQLVARTDSTTNNLSAYDTTSTASFTAFSELSLTPGAGGTLTFLAQDSSANFGLFQTTIGGSSGAIEHNADYSVQTDTTHDAPITEVHYTVNAAGQTAYTRRSTSNDARQIVRSGTGGFVISAGALTDFTSTATDQSYHRVQVAADGSAVFRATDATTGVIGIYRSTNLSSPIVTTSSLGAVVSASNDRVLYSDISNNTATLNITGVATPLAAYSTADLGGPHDAVMTQQSRVAFFNPDGGGTTIASLGYYPGSGNSTTTVATEHESFTSAGTTFTIVHLSSLPSRTSDPMLNDHGIVVFDATLTPDGGDAGSVTALIAWRESSPGTLQVVVKASDDADYADTYTDAAGVQHQITSLLLDGGIDQAGDVTKDALSDDDWLAFGIDYDHDAGYAVLEQQLAVPEPTSIGLIALTVPAALLKRRRRTATKHPQ